MLRTQPSGQLAGVGDDMTGFDELFAAEYARLVRSLGVALVRPGGMLVQASCSSRVDADTFAHTVFDAARRAEGAEWEEAVRFANAASAISVSAPGLSLPARTEVDTAVATLTAPATHLLAAVHVVSGDSADRSGSLVSDTGRDARRLRRARRRSASRSVSDTVADDGTRTRCVH
jgi:hypothetical protein